MLIFRIETPGICVYNTRHKGDTMKVNTLLQEFAILALMFLCMLWLFAAPVLASASGSPVWSALGSGTDQPVKALLATPWGDLYAGGDFATAGGEAAGKVAKWDGAAWSAFGAGLNGNVNAMALSSINNLYVAGDFTTAGGVNAAHVALYDAGGWHALGARDRRFG